MRTALKHSPTKAKLLDAAQALILAKGFVGTTVEDICQEAGLTKGSFFHYFDSKEKLALQLLKRYCAASKDTFLSACCGGEKDPLRRVYGFLDCVIEMAKKNAGKGCLLGSMTQELAETHAGIRSICAKAFGEMAKTLEQDLKAAKAKHKPGSSVDPRGLAEHFVVILEGSMLVSKVKNGGTSGEGIRHYKGYLQALFGR